MSPSRFAYETRLWAIGQIRQAIETPYESQSAPILAEFKHLLEDLRVQQKAVDMLERTEQLVRHLLDTMTMEGE